VRINTAQMPALGGIAVAMRGALDWHVAASRTQAAQVRACE
jgi:hypothetical protein